MPSADLYPLFYAGHFETETRDGRLDYPTYADRNDALDSYAADATEEKLWNEEGRAQLDKLPLATWASRRRQDLLELLDRMNPTIEELTAAVDNSQNGL